MKETEWVALLDEELKKLNAFAMAKEEDFVIKHNILRRKSDQLTSACDNFLECERCAELLNDLTTEIVRFHSELVFLIHFRDLNYTGLAKILKKHDKRTGMLLRDPYLQMALCQPFCVTDQVTKMIRWCEDKLQLLMGPRHAQDWHDDVSLIDASGLIEDSSMRDVHRSQVAALRILEELVNSASTPSVIPMPPIMVTRARSRGSSRLRPGGNPVANEQVDSEDDVEAAAADRDDESNDEGVPADVATAGLSGDHEAGSRAAILQRNSVRTSSEDGNCAGETQNAENQQQKAKHPEAPAPPRADDERTTCERNEESVNAERKLSEEEHQQQDTDTDTPIAPLTYTGVSDVAEKKRPS
ncbi:hypothetical protein CBR_g55079 [Chara braunii]|uniref:SPX domain-containing protein n=1 Tax=Chara braunii TaxID=69332 RepID=A0A388MCL9_CHABU|nr:hypothetical protein CBR_g55079 [Chara braunii]|eukprot:GBG92310.1 hypothetical protein CBR_g55079 [Chara braunii]